MPWKGASGAGYIGCNFTRDLPMHLPFISRRLVAMLAFCSAAAHATPVMEVRVDQLMFAANELKTTLALTPNQLTLWTQSTSKAAAILRARQQRREKLHAAVKTRLGVPQAELREVAAAVEAEADLSASEDKQLRELWLGVTDGLTDKQRAMATTELLSILDRVDAPDHATREHREGGKTPGGGGMRGRKPGGSGGGLGM
jgi:flagellar motility protein MotE (MotC chaperone)